MRVYRKTLIIGYCISFWSCDFQPFSYLGPRPIFNISKASFSVWLQPRDTHTCHGLKVGNRWHKAYYRGYDSTLCIQTKFRLCCKDNLLYSSRMSISLWYKKKWVCSCQSSMVEQKYFAIALTLKHDKLFTDEISCLLLRN